MLDIAQNYEKLADREQHSGGPLAVNSARRLLPPNGTPARGLVVDLSTVLAHRGHQEHARRRLVPMSAYGTKRKSRDV
jgi:hypothetical protein